MEHMIFCTPHILSFFRKAWISSMYLQEGSHSFCSSSLEENNSKSLVTIPNTPGCIVPSQLTLSLSSEAKASE